MKNLRPIYMVMLAAGLITLVAVISTILYKYLVFPKLAFSYIVLMAIIIYTTSHLIFYFILEKYIYRKIKLIYKSIYDLKSTPSAPKRVRLQDDVIDEVEKEVNEWADNKRNEIQKLKKMENYRREFLGNVSHELKTPIFNIQGYLDSLVYGGIYDDKINIKYLKKAIQNVERLEVIVSDLETISKMEIDTLSLSIEKFDIMTCVTQAVQSLEIQAQERNITLTVIDSKTPRYVLADEKRIQEVLINLIGNSIKYGTTDGTTKISVFDLDQNFLIEVSDNGIGIERNHLPRLFERFYRADTNRSRQQGGSGLGLAIVKHIVEAHKQTVQVRSTPGVGSTFGFTLKKG